MFGGNKNLGFRTSGISFEIEGLEDRQFLSAAPVGGYASAHSMTVGATHVSAKHKITVGPRLKSGAAIFNGTASGTDPRGLQVTDQLVLTLTQKADGSWEGEVTITGNRHDNLQTVGRVKIDAAGRITAYESGDGNTIVVSGQASGDWSTISGTYTGSDSEGHTWGGSFSLVRA